ncbi:MAG: glycoside hydrolase family 3 N-terminal domain-containing protein, partial [Ktedonobacteraceae bacterium]
MDFTEENITENQSRIEKDKEASEDVSKISVVKALDKSGDQTIDAFTKNSTEQLTEQLKERPVTIRKEAPDRDENGSLAVQDSVIEAASQPDVKLSNSSVEAPATSRKSVIPPRRSSFESVPQTPRIIKKSALNSAQALVSPQQDVQLGVTDQQSPPIRDETQVETQILPVTSPNEEPITGSIVESVAASETQILPVAPKGEDVSLSDLPTTRLPVTLPAQSSTPHESWLTRGRACLLATFLIMIMLNATMSGFGQFFGPQGWGLAFNTSNAGSNLLNQVSKQLGPHGLTPGTAGTAVPPTPVQIVNTLLQNMTLDQKIGQMLMVRFNYPTYGAALNAMLTQYHVGSVIEYAGNISSKTQLIELNKQIQQNAELPAIISVDQEGGTVDRLLNLDGRQPSASTIGATGDPNQAYQQGLKDAQALANYGFNLNLAPVVDVTDVYNPQLVDRTYGNNPTIVTEMAGAYLKGLQQSGKVLGTIKHFPGLGDTSTDPHIGLPILTRSEDNLNAIDWVPYKNLFSQNDVYSVMVTHELVKALDNSVPSSLSPKVVSVLRNQLGFQGVIITDGLTMDALMARYTLAQSAVMAIEAGDDLLMDPSSPNDVAQMIDGIKQAMSSG